ALWRTAPLLACALIALVVVLVSGGSSTKPVNAVAAARRAITPSADEIVYLRVTNRVGHIRGVNVTRQVAQKHTTEQWTAADPSRWRYVQTVPRDRRFGTVVSEGRRVIGREEFTYADGRQSTYDVNLGRVVVTEGF